MVQKYRGKFEALANEKNIELGNEVVEDKLEEVVDEGWWVWKYLMSYF